MLARPACCAAGVASSPYRAAWSGAPLARCQQSASLRRFRKCGHVMAGTCAGAERGGAAAQPRGGVRQRPDGPAAAPAGRGAAVAGVLRARRRPCGRPRRCARAPARPRRRHGHMARGCARLPRVARVCGQRGCAGRRRPGVRPGRAPLLQRGSPMYRPVLACSCEHPHPCSVRGGCWRAAARQGPAARGVSHKHRRPATT